MTPFSVATWPERHVWQCPLRLLNDIFTPVSRSQAATFAAVAVTLFFVGFLLASDTTIRFVEVSKDWGVTSGTTYGSALNNTYILESTGNGAAIFDFDNDSDVKQNDYVQFRARFNQSP